MIVYVLYIYIPTYVNSFRVDNKAIPSPVDTWTKLFINIYISTYIYVSRAFLVKSLYKCIEILFYNVCLCF